MNRGPGIPAMSVSDDISCIARDRACHGNKLFHSVAFNAPPVIPVHDTEFSAKFLFRPNEHL